MAAENRPTYNIYVSETTTGDPKTTRHFCQAGYDEQTGELIIKVVNGRRRASAVRRSTPWPTAVPDGLRAARRDIFHRRHTFYR